MVKFIHLRPRPESSYGGLTVAFEKEGSRIRFATSRCHFRDQFVKRLGRVKAAGRLQSDKIAEYVEGCSEKEFVDAIHTCYMPHENNLQIDVVYDSGQYVPPWETTSTR